jgi:hypothetical protein
MLLGLNKVADHRLQPESPGNLKQPKEAASKTGLLTGIKRQRPAA